VAPLGRGRGGRSTEGGKGNFLFVLREKKKKRLSVHSSKRKGGRKSSFIRKKATFDRRQGRPPKKGSHREEKGKKRKNWACKKDSNRGEGRAGWKGRSIDVRKREKKAEGGCLGENGRKKESEINEGPERERHGRSSMIRIWGGVRLEEAVGEEKVKEGKE